MKYMFILIYQDVSQYYPGIHCCLGAFDTLENANNAIQNHYEKGKYTNRSDYFIYNGENGEEENINGDIFFEKEEDERNKIEEYDKIHCKVKTCFNRCFNNTEFCSKHQTEFSRAINCTSSYYCKTLPSFNFPEKEIPILCKAHMEKGMVNIRRKKK